MKKIFLTITIILNSFLGKAQLIETNQISDWNTVQKAGFFYCNGKEGTNTPIINDSYWWWGLSSPSKGNVTNGTYLNAQIAILNASNPVKMYVRATNDSGVGTWAKVIHSKGDHAIDGKLTVKEVEIKINTGADFVFSPDYSLKPLSEVETFVRENRHLPDIPSEKQMQEDGLNLNDMQIKLLQKIEELTLYTIELEKKYNELKEELSNLKK